LHPAYPCSSRRSKFVTSRAPATREGQLDWLTRTFHYVCIVIPMSSFSSAPFWTYSARDPRSDADRQGPRLDECRRRADSAPTKYERKIQFPRVGRPSQSQQTACDAGRICGWAHSRCGARAGDWLLSTVAKACVSIHFNPDFSQPHCSKEDFIPLTPV